jgi:hypothetical protein
MNNAVLIQQVWPEDYGTGSYVPLIELTKERNEAYCEQHHFDYVYQIGTEGLTKTNLLDGCWSKVEMMKRALAQGYEYIVWLDVDALIYDTDTDLRDAFVNGIGACWMRIPQLHHWNVGVLYVRNTPQSIKFIDDWLALYPGGQQWREQGEFNKLALASKVVQTIADRWNATLNYSMVPDAVVLGYHGNGDAKQRYDMMQKTLQQKAQRGAE